MVPAGFGTALKPALEPITVARKPLSGTVAETVLAHGTGALNIDGCRVGTAPRTTHARGNVRGKPGEIYGGGKGLPSAEYEGAAARWPANLIHDGSEEVTGLLGEAARFFYCPKASKKDREEGLDGFDRKATAASEFRPNHAEKAAEGEDGNPYGRWQPRANNHPTVKPTDLMRYLCRLVTPPGGTVLDPFMGSGSTGKAAMLEGFRFIGCERDPDYLAIARARIARAAGVDPLDSELEDLI